MSDRGGVIVRVNGLDAIQAKLERLDQDVMTTVSQKLRAVALKIYGEILARSPVGESRKVRGVTITGGRYRGGWSPPDIREGRNEVTLRTSNNVLYAHPVTYGSEAGKRPWPKAGPRTVKQGNRVYSRQAVGGVVEPVFEGWADDVVEEIRKGLAERLK